MGMLAQKPGNDVIQATAVSIGAPDALGLMSKQMNKTLARIASTIDEFQSHRSSAPPRFDAHRA